MTASLVTLAAGADAATYYIEDPNRERSARRDDYYAPDGGGTWYSTGASIVRHAAAIDRATFRDLCAGYHPGNGGGAVRGSGPGHRAGWDLTFSAAKSVSLLWAFGTDEQRGWLERIQHEAVTEALALLTKESLVEVRLGAGGHLRETPTDLIVARFDHFTSREGDPNVHTHCVITNVAGSADGKWRTLEPERLFAAQMMVGAAMRAALAKRLVAEGLRLRPAGRGQFEIEGLSDDLLQAFSKRSLQVESASGRSASGAQKELAALLTRQAKAEVPLRAELEKRWREELDVFGGDPWMSVQDHRPTPDRDVALEREVQEFDPPAIAGTGPVAMAASSLFETRSVITRTALLQESFVRASLQGIGVTEVYKELDRLEQGGILARLADEEIGHRPDPARGACWTTAQIAASEARMLRAASRPDERQWITPEALSDALQAAPHLSDEQRAAVTHAANNDGVAVLEAGAGTGKTTTARALTQAAHKSGIKVVALAPSWIAADEVSASIGVPAQAIAKWRYERRNGIGSNLDANTLILIDEAGMVGTPDMAEILSVAAEQACKVVLLGDRRQLQSVPGANALGAITDVLQRLATMVEVRRQTVNWQRAASVLMARGDCEAGVRAYARHDRISLIEGATAAQEQVIAAWSAFRHARGPDALIVTRRNSDAAALNQKARAVLRSEGVLGPNDVQCPSIDREGKTREMAFALGDQVRFGETLPAFGIRNGTRASVARIERDDDARLSVTFRLEDGRIVSDAWQSFSRPGPGKLKAPPRITHAYAGTAYAAQGRTVTSAVLYVAQPTDARELYVGLTRHTDDVRLVVERGRLDAAVRKHQPDPRLPATPAAMLERFFLEARRYAEKRNVVDYIEDRNSFVTNGTIPRRARDVDFDVKRAARSARLLATVQAELARATTLFWSVRLFTAVFRAKARDVVRPIEQRVRSLIRGVSPAPTNDRREHVPDYGR